MIIIEFPPVRPEYGVYFLHSHMKTSSTVKEAERDFKRLSLCFGGGEILRHDHRENRQLSNPGLPFKYSD